MSASLLTTARTERTGFSIATDRFKARRARWRGSRSVPEEQFPSRFAIGRELEAYERSLVHRIRNFIAPTLTHTDHQFQRPWPRGATARASEASTNDPQDLVHCIEMSVSRFNDETPALLSLLPPETSTSPQAACLRAMDMQMIGETYQAACLLKHVIDSNEACPKIVHLHYADVLSSLRIHHRQLWRPARHTATLGNGDALDTVGTSLAMYRSLDNLYEPLGTTREAPFPPSAQDAMLLGPIGSLTLPDIFAIVKICYCQSVTTYIRHASITRHEVDVADIQDQTVARLLSIWQYLKSDNRVSRRDFLIWRCARALRYSVPFHEALPDLSANQDALSLFITEKADPEPEHLVVLQRWRAGHPVQDHQLQLLADCLATLIGRKDFSALDDALFAIQMIEHTGLVELQRRLRRLSWKLHVALMPFAPWILDYMLLHPLVLWVGWSARHGRLPSSDPPVAESTDSGTRVPHYHRLQFGFEGMREREENSMDFVHSWSILYQCLQYTVAPFDDALYELLFVDADLFSWSQLCHYLRQVCDLQPAPSSHHRSVSLDGTSQEHGYFAGLGTIELVSAGQDKVSRLGQLIDGLDALRHDLQDVIESKGGSRGLQHLRALCLVWKGTALLERAAERCQTSGLQYDTAVERESVKSDLSTAGDIFRQAGEESRGFEWLAISRLGMDGLLKVHKASRTLAPSDRSDPRPVADAESLLHLCEEYHHPLRLAVMQQHGTSQYAFVSETGTYYSTATKDPPSELYHCAEQASLVMGQTDLAVAWVLLQCEDSLEGRQRCSRRADAPQMRKLTDDAPFTLATAPDPDVLAYLLGHARPSVKTSSAIVRQIASGLPEDIHPASFILFSSVKELFGEEDRRVIKVYAIKSQGRGTEHTTTEQDVEALGNQKRWFGKRSDWDSNVDDEAGFLSELGKGIAQVTRTNELLVLVPGPLCVGLPLHVAQHRPGTILWWRNPIVYAPDPNLFRDCVQRALTSPRAIPGRPHAFVAGVYEGSFREGEANTVHDTAQVVAASINCTALIGEEVTRSVMEQALTQQDWVIFIGHGHGGLVDKGQTLHEPRLKLTNPELLFESNLHDLNLAPSHIELIACGSGQFRVHAGMELSSMTETALVRGAASVLGTMVDTRVVAGIEMLKCLGARLAQALASQEALWNVAAALRASAESMALTSWPQLAWRPFYIQGSPVMLLTGRRQSAEGRD